MGKAVSVWVMGVAMVLLGALAMVGALQEATGGVDSGVQANPCAVLVDYEDQGGDAFNAWVQEQGATNVVFTTTYGYGYGTWVADGEAVGYGFTEDSAIHNYAECVR